MTQSTRDAAGLLPRERELVTLVMGGMSQGEAYRIAYGKPPKDAQHPTYTVGHCNKKANEILARPHVRLELKACKDAVLAAARQSAVADAAVTPAYVMRSLHEVAERCLQHRPVLDSKGKRVFIEVEGPDGTEQTAAAFTFDAKGAVAALVPLGKQLGMFVDRKEVRTGPLPDLDDSALDRRVLDLMQELADATGQTVIEVAAQHGVAITPAQPVASTMAGATPPTPTPRGDGQIALGPPSHIQ